MVLTAGHNGRINFDLNVFVRLFLYQMHGTFKKQREMSAETPHNGGVEVSKWLQLAATRLCE